MFIAVVGTDGDRVSKWKEFATEAEAQAHVSTHGGFVASNPPGNSFTWKVSGNTLLDEAPPATVPLYVTRYQFKKAVLDAGQLATLQGAYAGLTDAAKLYWDEAGHISRNSVLVTELQAALSLSDAQVDNFFIAAKDIRT